MSACARWFSVSMVVLAFAGAFTPGCPKPSEAEAPAEGEGEGGEGAPALEGEGPGEGQAEGEGELVEVVPYAAGEAAGERRSIEGFDMLWVPAGTFLMGAAEGEPGAEPDERPRHEVTLSKGFWLGRFELTKNEWTAWRGDAPWQDRPYVSTAADSPVVYVSWEDVQGFLGVVRRQTGYDFRLPTEAEWEYACRAGTTTAFFHGDDPDFAALDDYAWWSADVCQTRAPGEHRVGRKASSPWGFFDMGGNVAEWCAAWHGEYDDDGVVDPTGPEEGNLRSVRGGGSCSPGFECRSAARYARGPSTKSTGIGFRLCLGAE